MPSFVFAKILTVRQLFNREQLFERVKDSKQEEEFMKKLKLFFQQLESDALETEKALYNKIFDKSEQKEKLVLANLH